jgi:sterol 3beta-glucosyltransferase
MLAFPSLFARLPGYNALSYRLAEQLVWQWYRLTINHWRKDTLGLAKHPLGGYFGQLEQRRIPVLNGFSAHVVPRPSGWGNHIHLTGYWFPDDETWQPSDKRLKANERFE